MLSTMTMNMLVCVIVICVLQIIKAHLISAVNLKHLLFPVFYLPEWSVLTPKNIIQMIMGV